MQQQINDAYTRCAKPLAVWLTFCLLYNGCDGTAIDWEARLSDRDPQVRGEAVGNRKELRSDGLPRLLTALEDEERPVRIAAAEAIMQAGKDPEARATAIRTHGKIASEVREVMPTLLKAFRDEDSSVRIAALEVVAETGSALKDAAPSLRESLHSKHREVRMLAARALGAIGSGDADAILALRELPRDEFWGVRMAAAEALGKCGPRAKRAIPALEEALRDEDRGVGKEASYALRHIDPKTPAACEAALPDRKLPPQEKLSETVTLERPKLRPLDIVPVGRKEDLRFAVRDPEGFSRPVVVSQGAAILASLMDGRRTLAEIQMAFRERVGVPVALAELKQFIRQLDEAHLLAGERFEQHARRQIQQYLDNPVRPAAHAGGAYEKEPEALRRQLGTFFERAGKAGTSEVSKAPHGLRLCGIVSPHIDLNRGGSTYAQVYSRVPRESKADLFVIFGTAHTYMRQRFCVSRKDFDTPLGVVRTDKRFVDQLAMTLSASRAGRHIDLFEDEKAHRHEHSIEFQALFLQYLLGRERDFRIVPVLVGSLGDFIKNEITPDDSPAIESFITAVRDTASRYSRRVCYISSGDFAHRGRRYGDAWSMDKRRLHEQSKDDHALLAIACRCDPSGFFKYVSRQNDRSRICGLAPTYVMLRVAAPTRGELLKYDQVVDADGTSCTTIAALAFYKE